MCSAPAHTARSTPRLTSGRRILLCAALVFAPLLLAPGTGAQPPAPSRTPPVSGSAQTSSSPEIPAEQMHQLCVFLCFAELSVLCILMHSYVYCMCKCTRVRALCGLSCAVLCCRVRAWARALGDRLQDSVHTITAYDDIRKVRLPANQHTEQQRHDHCTCLRATRAELRLLHNRGIRVRVRAGSERLESRRGGGRRQAGAQRHRHAHHQNAQEEGRGRFGECAFSLHCTCTLLCNVLYFSQSAIQLAYITPESTSTSNTVNELRGYWYWKVEGPYP